MPPHGLERVVDRRQLLRAEQLAIAEEEAEENKTAKHKYTWCQQHYAKMAKVSTEDLQAALKLLNGEGDKKDAQRVRNGEVANVVSAGNRLYTLPGFGPVHLVRWLTASHHWRSFWADDGFQKWLGQQPAGSVDLRALAAVFQRAGLPLEDVARAALCQPAPPSRKLFPQRTPPWTSPTHPRSSTCSSA